MTTHENPAFIGDDGNSKNTLPSSSETELSIRSSTKNNLNQHQQNHETLPTKNETFTDISPIKNYTTILSITIGNSNSNNTNPSSPTTTTTTTPTESKTRENWGNDIEFLFSCIAMSVGLGNVWRFPFVALENGGGAFLIPYLIVLFLVGKPIYYLEMLMGQFSSRGPVKVYDLCPAMKGIGIGQVISITIVSTYYVALMAITLKFTFESFRSILPWSICNDEWNVECLPSASIEFNNASLITNNNNNMTIRSIYDNNTNSYDNNSINNANFSDSIISSNSSRPKSSAELYFLKEVLQEIDSIDNGIGNPNWQLVIALLISWLTIFLLILRGVKSSGKASYFLAIFPYVILGVLLIHAVTLPGSLNGIIYFIKPQWEQILNPKVWYSAVTQVFFSLTVCFGNIIMYASYNRFEHNIHRDVTIVTILDTFTSLLAGVTIFGILGHLAYEIGTDDVSTVVKGGTGLAFISYPDAIAKFKSLPQLFSVLFFIMLFVLGVGSNVAMSSCTVTAIRDHFPKIKYWHASLGMVTFGFGFGIIYLTPGGQFILNLVDYFGASMIAIVLAIAELITFSWIYGVRRLCRDAEFMIGKNPNLYWRICWGVITPTLMIIILIYTFAAYEPLTYKDQTYPDWAYTFGWIISGIGIIQIPIWACVAIIRQPSDTLIEKIYAAFRPKSNWGPIDVSLQEKYQKFLVADEGDRIFEKTGFLWSIKSNLLD